MPKLPGLDAIPLIAIWTPLPLLILFISSEADDAARSSKVFMFRFSISSSVYAVIATGMSRTDSSVARAVTTISSIDEESWATSESWA